MRKCVRQGVLLQKPSRTSSSQAPLDQRVSVATLKEWIREAYFVLPLSDYRCISTWQQKSWVQGQKRGRQRKTREGKRQGQGKAQPERGPRCKREFEFFLRLSFRVLFTVSQMEPQARRMQTTSHRRDPSLSPCSSKTGLSLKADGPAQPEETLLVDSGPDDHVYRPTFAAESPTSKGDGGALLKVFSSDTSRFGHLPVVNMPLNTRSVGTFSLHVQKGWRLGVDMPKISFWSTAASVGHHVPFQSVGQRAVPNVTQADPNVATHCA